MAYIHKLPSGLWRAEVARRGVRKTSTHGTKSAASQWATAVEAEILAGQTRQYPRKTVADALRRYALEVSPSKRSGANEAARLAAFQREPWADLLLTDLTPEDLGQWRDRRLLVVKPESVRRDFTVLSAVLQRAAKEWRWMPSSPLSDVTWPAPGKPRDQMPRWREIRRFCRSVGYVTGRPPQTLTCELAYLLLLSLRTAMRKGEMLGLTVDRVDMAGRVVTLPMTKNGDARDVPLSRRAVRILTPIYPRLFTVDSDSADALWRKVCRRVGLTNWHLHDARAAALTSMARRVDILTLARISGHRDVRMLLRYYRASASEIADRL